MPNRVGSWGPTAAPQGRGPSTGRPAEFEPGKTVKLDIKEASDVVALPGGRFAVVGDRSDAVRLVEADGTVSKLRLPDLRNGKSQLEGVAFDPKRNHLFVVREESRTLLRYEWNPERDRPPRLEKAFDLDPRGPKNKGIEGVAYLPAELSPTGNPQLLLAKEGQPRSLTLRDDGGGGKDLPVVLEAQVRSVCKDFSAVAVDPKTGHIFLSSDESSTVAQVRLVRDGDKVRGQLVQSIPLRHGDKPLKRVEGLTFDAKGNLYVLTENDGALHRLNRK